jgi:hypothetical protein
VHATAAEAGGFAGRPEAVEDLALGVEDAGLEIGLQSA